ncbi:hypothetical protein [Brachybacterium epidermidis]|uniref:hypothetical protein n=1 Tax=Brachybacterium epidermidis TaxID=2781983 RepID=UPI00398E3602
MNWIVDLVAVLAAPAAGAFGAWFGGTAAVKSAVASADADRRAEAQRHERERRDAYEQEVYARADELVAAVIRQRSLPLTDAMKQDGQGWGESGTPEYRSARAAVQESLARMLVRFPEVGSEATAVAREGGLGDAADDELLEAVTALNHGIRARIGKVFEGRG